MIIIMSIRIHINIRILETLVLVFVIVIASLLAFKWCVQDSGS